MWRWLRRLIGGVKPAPLRPRWRPTAEGGATQLAAQINAARLERGRDDLVAFADASREAYLHARALARGLRHSHEGFAERAAGLGRHPVAENVARRPSPHQCVEAWLRSHQHRINLLNESYTHVGVGCATSDDGGVYWCAIFCGPYELDKESNDGDTR